jgi:hypothetical protein
MLWWLRDEATSAAMKKEEKIKIKFIEESSLMQFKL